MSFPGLDSYQKKNPDLPVKIRGLLPKLGKYLEAELARKKVDEFEPTRDIVPDTLANRLKIDEAVALTLLMIYENAGVVKPNYHVLCPDTDNFLQAFKSPSDLPETIHCPYHPVEKDHDKSEYYVDLVFRFSPTVMKDYIRPKKVNKSSPR